MIATCCLKSTVMAGSFAARAYVSTVVGLAADPMSANAPPVPTELVAFAWSLEGNA